MSMHFTRFSRATAERAIKTFVQAAAASLATGVDWQHAGVLAALAACASVLTSGASLPLGPVGSPSLTRAP